MIDWLRREISEPAIMLGGTQRPIAIRRHPTARRMTLRLAPDGSEVLVTLPRWGRTREAIAFAETRRDWLESQLARVPQQQIIGPGATIAYLGAGLTIDWRADLPRTPRLEGARLVLGGPEAGLARRVQRWLEGEALRLLQADLAGYCAAADRPVPPLRLSRAQRRWGSCSSNGTVRINWRLVQAPDFVRRSVVAHEVAHLVHFDHSAAFHALLRMIYEGDTGAADRWLKREGRGLYASFG
ncbi:MAG: M48 family metallopeptidase [Novosphingobium sp.]